MPLVVERGGYNSGGFCRGQNLALGNKALPKQLENEAPRMTIGVGFDHARIAAALVDDAGRIAAERRAAMPSRTTRAAVAEMTRLILELAAAPERGASRIHSIGFAADGLVDPLTGRVTMAALKGWTRVPVAALVDAALDEAGHDIRTPSTQKHARAERAASPHPAMAVHSRPPAMAAGEAWRGAAKGKGNVVYVSLDAAIAVGIIVEGRVLRGAGGVAGQAAWMALTPEFKPEYETRGCLAAEADPDALARRALEGWSGIADSLLGGLIKSDPMAIDAVMLLRSAQGGDDLAARVVHETCGWIGRGIANLISILNPDAVVIGGELGALLKPHLDAIRDEARRWAHPEAGRACKIVSATLGEQAIVLGAARLGA
jgi:glucokinase